MSKQQTPAVTIYPWLKANLGKNCLAPLTGTDYRALNAAVETMALYLYSPDPTLIDAFAFIVQRMQPSTRYFAYHAIAHVLDWNDRPRIWQLAGLGKCPASRCAHEPKLSDTEALVRQETHHGDC